MKGARCKFCKYRHDASQPCRPNAAARAAGLADRSANHYDASRWPPGSYGHADYQMAYFNGANKMDGDNIGHALRGYADRILNLDKEKDALNGDRREVFAEAKEAGFNVTTLREIVREMKMEPEARASRYQLLDEYRQAVGILADTPLGRAAEGNIGDEPNDDPPPRRRGRPPRQAQPEPMFDA